MQPTINQKAVQQLAALFEGLSAIEQFRLLAALEESGEGLYLAWACRETDPEVIGLLREGAEAEAENAWRLRRILEIKGA